MNLVPLPLNQNPNPIKIRVLFLSLLLCQVSMAQLSGIKTIPGNYPTIAAAIADLNVQGEGTGGVTFSIAAGHTETFSSPTSWNY